VTSTHRRMVRRKTSGTTYLRSRRIRKTNPGKISQHGNGGRRISEKRLRSPLTLRGYAEQT